MRLVEGAVDKHGLLAYSQRPALGGPRPIASPSLMHLQLALALRLRVHAAPERCCRQLVLIVSTGMKCCASTLRSRINAPSLHDDSSALVHRELRISEQLPEVPAVPTQVGPIAVRTDDLALKNSCRFSNSISANSSGG